jgi:hypothetical protein
MQGPRPSDAENVGILPPPPPGLPSARRGGIELRVSHRNEGFHGPGPLGPIRTHPSVRFLHYRRHAAVRAVRVALRRRGQAAVLSEAHGHQPLLGRAPHARGRIDPSRRRRSQDLRADAPAAVRRPGPDGRRARGLAVAVGIRRVHPNVSALPGLHHDHSVGGHCGVVRGVLDLLLLPRVYRGGEEEGQSEGRGGT